MCISFMRLFNSVGDVIAGDMIICFMSMLRFFCYFFSFSRGFSRNHVFGVELDFAEAKAFLVRGDLLFHWSLCVAMILAGACLISRIK